MESKNFFIFILVILFLLSSFYQNLRFSPMTPRGLGLKDHSVFSGYLLQKPKSIQPVKTQITIQELGKKHGRVEKILLIDGRIIQGVVIQQTETHLKIETTNSFIMIEKDTVDSVEIMK